MRLDNLLQWIAVGVVVALCLWRLIEWLMRPKRLSGGCETGCSGCSIAENCALKSHQREDERSKDGGQKSVED